ncbi:MAG: cytochrome c biogenesis protein CcdA [Thermococci archaeon]|nr:cytochrome c biogenesis protein CcdA [Thermococci archaeon]
MAKGDIIALISVVGIAVGLSSLILWALGLKWFIPQFFALSLSDSINPCTFVIYTMLLVALAVKEVSGREFYLAGLGFISAIYVSYYTFGVGLVLTVGRFPTWTGGVAAILFGLYTVITGLLGKSRIAAKKNVRRRIFKANASFWSSFLVGIFVSATLLPCSSGPYLVYSIIIAKAGTKLFWLMLGLYNLVFVIPLFVILFGVGGAIKGKGVSRAIVRRSRELSVASGLALIAIGLWILH